MDLVILMVLATHVTLLLGAGMLLTIRQPPIECHSVICPEDQQPASVLVTWDGIKRCVAIAGCDRPSWAEGRCPESCRGVLSAAFLKQVPTTVTP